MMPSVTPPGSPKPSMEVRMDWTDPALPRLNERAMLWCTEPFRSRSEAHWSAESPGPKVSSTTVPAALACPARPHSSSDAAMRERVCIWNVMRVSLGSGAAAGDGTDDGEAGDQQRIALGLGD